MRDRRYDSATETHCAIAVVGAGPAGLAAALALAHAGAEVVLIGPAPLKESRHLLDTRTAALLASSVDLLKALNVWDALAGQAAPLKAIRIVDASDSLLRAPEIEFKASELGRDAFGYNIPNSTLVEALYARAVQSSCAVEASSVKHIDIMTSHAVLHCNGGLRLACRLVAGADGRRSICREAAGITVTEWGYGQRAIATSFEHTLAHGSVSTEIHQRAGSLTTVPLSDANASSLIWVGAMAEIDALMKLDALAFAHALEERLGSLLGRVGGIGGRAHFPIAGLAAKRLAQHRTALLGEAAHILPPIGAQGLNLGLRDAASLADCVGAALKRAADPGGDDVLGAYEQARKLDVLTRTLGVDLLNRSLLTGFLPLQAARGIFLHGLNRIGPLRRLVMRAGMGPPMELPSLMRPAAG